MMEQYWRIKNEYNDCLIFFRLGDFYELFFDDAITAAKELELVLTGRADNNTLVHFAADSSYVGNFVNVRITGCKTFYLIGEAL